MLACLRNFFMPTVESDTPKWFYATGRLLVALAILGAQVLYDARVPEVSGDPRWYLFTWVAVTLTTLWLWVKVSSSKKPAVSVRLPLVGWLAAFVLFMAAASHLWAVNTYATLWNFQHLVGYIGVFAFTIYLRNPAWYRNLLWLVAAGVLFNGLLGICQFYDLTNTWAGIPKQLADFIDYFRQAAPPAGTFANKNLAASYMVLTLPVVAYLIVTTRSKWGEFFAAISFTAGACLLIYTRSRASWVSAIGALLVFALWLVFYKPARKALWQVLPRRKLLTIISALIVVSIAAQGTTGITRQFHAVGKTVAEQTASIADIQGTEISSRLAYTVNGAAMLKDHPLLGVGLGNFDTIFPLYYAAWYKTPFYGYNVELRPRRMHNDFGQMFVELGLPGGLAFALIFLSVPYMACVLPRRKKQNGFDPAFPVFALWGVAGFCANALADFPMQLPGGAMLAWAMVALLTGQYLATGGRTFALPLRAPKLVATSGLLFMVAAVGALGYDNFHRQESAIHVKALMSYGNKRIYDENTLWFTRKAYDALPWEPNLLEYAGVVYANYNGKSPRLGLPERIEQVRHALKKDPYAASNLINLAGLLSRRIMELEKLGDTTSKAPLLEELKSVYKTLLQVADFSPLTFTIGGMYYTQSGQEETAVSLFRRALDMDPGNTPANAGMRLAISQLKGKGKEVPEWAYVNMGNTVKPPKPKNPTPNAEPRQPSETGPAAK